MENTNRVRGKASRKNLTIQGRTIPSGDLEGGGGVIGGRKMRIALLCCALDELRCVLGVVDGEGLV